MATNAVLVCCDTERFAAVVAGAAGFSGFHFGHGSAVLCFQVENGAVTGPAVIIIFTEMQIMAENNRVGIFKAELDVFCFSGGQHEGCQENKQGNDGEAKLHGALLVA